MPKRTGKSYSFYPRRRKSGTIWFVRWRQPDGTWNAGTSTGCTTKADAEAHVERQLIATGRPQRRSGRRVPFDAFARDFWKPDGPYVKMRLAHGHSLGPTYVRNQQRHVDAYLVPTFGSRPLDEIDAVTIDGWLVELYHHGRPIEVWDRKQKRTVKKRRPLSGATLNGVRKCLVHIFAEAKRQRLIRENPMDEVPALKENRRRRSVFRLHELQALVDPGRLGDVWNGDERMRLLLGTAILTGARQAELRALQPRFVQSGAIHIVHALDDDPVNGGLKPPKNGHTRWAPLPPRLGQSLLEWAEANRIPADGFLFADPPFERPLSKDRITKRFYRALAAIGIDGEQRRERRLVWHGLRHSFATAARSAGVDKWQLMQTVGHLDERTNESYSDHAEVEHLTGVVEFQDRFVEQLALTVPATAREVVG